MDKQSLIEQAFSHFESHTDYGGAPPHITDIIAGLVWERIEGVVEEGVLTEIGDIVSEATDRSDKDVDEVLANYR